MSNVEPEKSPDIFAAAECGVAGSGERTSRASGVVRLHSDCGSNVPIVLLTNRIGTLVLSAPTDLGVNFSESGIGHDL